MPLILQHRIYRSDLKNNPSVLYLFGDNEQRRGLGGQARECRGEPNAVGIATKRTPSRSEDAYWSDVEFDRCAEIVRDDFNRAMDHVNSGKIVVCPSDGLGSGLSELPERAPEIFKLINDLIEELKTL